MLLAVTLAGCSGSAPIEFRLNLEGKAPESVGRADREGLNKLLSKLFGTPDQPMFPEGVGLDGELLEQAAGPIWSDEDGTQHGLFRQHCVTCHGISGDGAGPAAPMLSPYPRDFRRGLFKYTRTRDGAKPVDEDLRRTLVAGVPGTAMPSFAMLSKREIDALVQYVKYLSIRGEVERILVARVVDANEDIEYEDGVDEAVSTFEMWEEAPEKAISVEDALDSRPPVGTPQQLADSVAKGRAIYASKKSQCVKCHGPEGRGDGEEPELYDDWNKEKKGISPEKTAELAGRFTLPLQKLYPRNFREGVFHGGARPVDLYWRIHVGIKGTAMPAAGPSAGAPGVLTPQEIWHVVDYVRSLAEEGE